MASEQTTIAKFFEILEITQDEQLKLSTSTKDEQINLITKRYRSLALLHHPDKNQGSKNAEKEFKNILNAYESLKKQVDSGIKLPSPQTKKRSKNDVQLNKTYIPEAEMDTPGKYQPTIILNESISINKQLNQEFEDKLDIIIKKHYEELSTKKHDHYQLYLIDKYKNYATSLELNNASRKNQIENSYELTDAIRQKRNISFGLSFLIIPLFFGIFYQVQLKKLEKQKSAELEKLPQPESFEVWKSKNEQELEPEWNKKILNEHNFGKQVIELSSNNEEPKPSYLGKVLEAVNILQANLISTREYNSKLHKQYLRGQKNRIEKKDMVRELFIKTLDDPRQRNIEENLSALKNKIKTENQPQAKTKVETEIKKLIERNTITMR